MANIGRLNVQIGVDLAAFRNDMNKAFKTLNSSTAQMKRSLKGLEGSFQSLNRMVGFFATGLAGLALIRVSKDVIFAADAFNQLQAKISNSVDSSTSVKQVFDQIVASSNRTGTSVEAVAQAFARMRPAALELGKSNKDLIQFNETFQKMGILAGATSEEVKNTMIQLSQGIASNRLGGDELRSVLEQMPPVARAIADSMKIPMSQLKDLAKEGKITADVVMNAIQSKTKEVDEAFAKLPPSVERSATRIRNELMLLLGAINDDVTATGNFSKALDDLAGFLKGRRQDIVNLAREIVELVKQAGRATAEIIKLGGAFLGIKEDNNLLSKFLRGVANDFDFVATAAESARIAMEGFREFATDTKAKEYAKQFTTPEGRKQAILDFRKFNGSQSDAAQQKPWKAFMDRVAGREGGFNPAETFQDMWFRVQNSMKRGTSTLTKSPFSGGGGEKGKKSKSQSVMHPDLVRQERGLNIEAKWLEGFEADSTIFKENYEAAKSVIEGMKTPIEQLQEQFRTLNTALTIGAIAPKDFTEAMKRLNEAFQDDSPIELRQMSEEATKALQAQKDMLISVRGDQDGYRQGMSNLISATQAYNLTAGEQKQIQEGLKLQFGLLKDDGINAMTSLEAAMRGVGSHLEEVFMNFTKTGKFAFKDLVASALQEISRLVLGMTVIGPLFGGYGTKPKESFFGKLLPKILGGIGSSVGGGGGGGKVFTQIPTPSLAFKGFASGGNFSAGQPMMVGENGMELMVPRSAGTVIPNHALGGNVVNLHQYFTIQTNDSKSFKDQLAGHAKYIGDVGVQAIQRQSNRAGNRSTMER